MNEQSNKNAKVEQLTKMFLSREEEKALIVKDPLATNLINFEADMKSYKPLETAAIFFLANLFPKQGISSEYVTADFIRWAYSGCKERKPRISKWKILAHTGTRTHDP